ncbi:MAG: DNA polymerase I [Limosilactobacillus sp.]|uniref:DNA polymerase I n=1 Tax=Limosilactobacillus sp. TaxID=2773925 RepID=UPI002707ECBE|nr:DNA polymerase I [Limosilactobacillus sp.]
MTKQLLLIDGNSILFRAFFAMHNQMERFVNKDGLHTAAIYGFKLMLDHVLDSYHPDAALVAFDAGKTTFRTKMYDDYKGGRDKTPGELSEQFPYVRKMIEACGLHTYDLKDYEADDIIGTLAKQGDENGYKTLIVTGDRDLTQLASEHTTVAVTKKGVTEIEHYTPAHVEEKLGITPTQIIDMKALMGDTSDNYPGVTKVGEKTAIKLVKQFGSVENLYDNIDELKASKMKEHLIEDEEVARQCKTLATILRDAPLAIGLDDIQFKGEQTEDLAKFYQEMGFKSFLAKMNVLPLGDDIEAAKPIEYTELNADNLDQVKHLSGNISFFLEIELPNYHRSTLAGFALGQGDKWFVSRDVELLKRDELKALLESDQISKNVYDVKAQTVALHRLGIELNNVDFDPQMAAYLLNTMDPTSDLGTLAHEYDYYSLQSDTEVYGKGAKRAIPADDKVFFNHIAQKARAISELKDKLYKQLDDNKQMPLYDEIEMPLARVLAKMEIAGVHVNDQTLKEMGSKMQERLADLEQQIYNEAGEEFNINSPKQLGEILFVKMGLRVVKKTKTGFSTAVDVLEQLAAEAPIVSYILEYRQISKLLSTYVTGLLKEIYPEDHKIHTRYLQTLTQTGRLSSVEPNLQNIPVRLEEGRMIRKAFTPSHEGWKIFSSDYSQVELRVLAHITGDENLINDFKNGEDIHAATARRIFHLPEDAEIDKNMRRRAKAVNFGIVYGISDFGLASRINVTRKQAHEFIENYFKEFPGVKKYIDDTIQSARDNGYVETITHRRRYLPDINSKRFNLRSFAERTAMNTPIQGSAADIIKIAMIKMQDALKERGLKAKMLLQIHDELVFEAPEEEIPVLQELVPSVMDSAVDLNVPLKVESKVGDTWYDLK